MKEQDLENKTKTELLELARQLEVRGRSLMSKKALMGAIAKAQASASVLSSKKSAGKVLKRAPLATPTKPKAILSPSSKTKLKSSEVLIKPPSVAAVPQVAAPAAHAAWHLPQHYGTHRLVLMIIDPTHVFAYWEFLGEHFEQVRAGQMGDMVLRLYDVTDIHFNGGNAWHHDDHYVGMASSWYLSTGAADRSVVAELGWMTHAGEFRPLLRSNVVRTPSDRPSNRMDEEWMVVESDFDRIYALSGGLPHGVWQKTGSSAGWQTDQMAMRLRLGLSSQQAVPHALAAD